MFIVKYIYQRWSDSVFSLSDPILFLKSDIPFPIPGLVKIIGLLSVSENYPKVYYDAQHTFLCSVYFASWGKITDEVILPLAEQDWLK